MFHNIHKKINVQKMLKKNKEHEFYFAICLSGVDLIHYIILKNVHSEFMIREYINI